MRKNFTATEKGRKVDNMDILCAWCGKEMGTKPGLGVEGVSHTICQDCLKVELRKIENKESPGTTAEIVCSPEVIFDLCIGVKSDDYRTLIESVLGVGLFVDVPYPAGQGFPLTIIMPCGSTVIYNHFKEVSQEDVPCPCGDPKHWLIQYRKKEVKHDA